MIVQGRQYNQVLELPDKAIAREEPELKQIEVNNVEVELNALTCIDTTTNLVELIRIDNKQMDHIRDKFTQAWLCRYPRPSKVRFDNGSEFKKDCFPLLKDFVIKLKPTSIKNPRSNSIVEQIYQVMGNILRVKDLNNWDFDDVDPSGLIISEVA